MERPTDLRQAILLLRVEKHDVQVLIPSEAGGEEPDDLHHERGIGGTGET